ncbi:MAG TPA: SDR family NAD(P)-dependent oxidoreductase [Solirubrobacteraceae bacterium]|nr:SDR family NAD(P)-dependent oxidoreductase [Solirubrobacteraceae bacterium]
MLRLTRSRPPAGAGGKRVLVLGGTSEIALAIVRELQAHSPRQVALLGRDRRALARAASDLRAHGCERVLELELDALEPERHAQATADARERLGGVDVVILAVGVLGERGGLPDDVASALSVLKVNVVGAGSLLLHAAHALRGAGGGTLIVLSSVAAERPRRANVVYGASKAALDALAQGLADALAGDGVRLLTVRPGFVRTRMTAGLSAAPLATTPEAVASVVIGGLERGEHTVWAPRKLRWLMFVVRLLPRPIFRRMER